MEVASKVIISRPVTVFPHNYVACYAAVHNITQSLAASQPSQWQIAALDQLMKMQPQVLKLGMHISIFWPYLMKFITVSPHFCHSRQFCVEIPGTEATLASAICPNKSMKVPAVSHHCMLQFPYNVIMTHAPHSQHYNRGALYSPIITW